MHHSKLHLVHQKGIKLLEPSVGVTCQKDSLKVLPQTRQELIAIASAQPAACDWTCQLMSGLVTHTTCALYCHSAEIAYKLGTDDM